MSGSQQTLQRELDALDDAWRARLEQRGFDRDSLSSWAATIGGDKDRKNRLPGVVTAVDDAAIESVPSDEAERARLAAIGKEALARGELAVCVLAGGMATRMGGVVKALVDALEGVTFLDLRLAECARLEAEHGKSVPLWLMTSEPTDAPIRRALAERGEREVAAFEQLVSLRLTLGGTLFYDAGGQPSIYATGHGDLPDALARSGLLDTFLARGGRYLWIENLDNLGARVDQVILGGHIDRAAPLTVELVDKRVGDKGGGPVLHDGRPIIAEQFRLPPSFDADRVRVFNTNTFLVDARALAQLRMPWTYLEVHKQVDERTAVQFERLLGEMTMAIEPRFLRVSRDGTESRFLPCKDYDDLEAARPLVEALYRRDRGD
jgi:UTP--glucose-1-phosphate uridylyltransferase